MSKIDPWGWRQLDERRAHYEFDADFTDTPYLTALVQVATAIGTFIGIFAAIGLAYQWHNGIADYWSLILILVLDVLVNVGARVTRRRRRRAEADRRT
jgi:hypothetical protein